MADGHTQELWVTCDLEMSLKVAVDDAAICSRGRREAHRGGRDSHRLWDQVLIIR